MGQYNTPTRPDLPAGRSEAGPVTRFRERTRSEDIEIARKYKEEDPIAWAGTRAQRLLRDQQAEEREKEAEARKLAHAEHVKAETIRMEKEWARVKREDQAAEDRIAQASRDAFEQRILKAKEKENTRRRSMGLPPLPDLRS